MSRLVVACGVDPPLLLVEIQQRIASKKIHMGLPQAIDRADILPVALERVHMELDVVLRASSE